jgi:hypothetical protein
VTGGRGGRPALGGIDVGVGVAVGVTGADEFGVFDLEVLRVAGIRVFIACSRKLAALDPTEFAIVGRKRSTNPKFDESLISLHEAPSEAGR